MSFIVSMFDLKKSIKQIVLHSQFGLMLYYHRCQDEKQN